MFVWGITFFVKVFLQGRCQVFLRSRVARHLLFGADDVLNAPGWGAV